jgi:hypothetical protein
MEQPLLMEAQDMILTWLQAMPFCSTAFSKTLYIITELQAAQAKEMHRALT